MYDLKHDFNSERYHPTYNNCNDFSLEFCDQILNKSFVNVLVPNYVSRLPKICSCMGCIISKSFDCDLKGNKLIYEKEQIPLIAETKYSDAIKRKNSFDEVVNGYEMV